MNAFQPLYIFFIFDTKIKRIKCTDDIKKNINGRANVKGKIKNDIYT